MNAENLETLCNDEANTMNKSSTETKEAIDQNL